MISQICCFDSLRLKAPIGGGMCAAAITSRGQTVIPAEIRRLFNLSPSDRLEWFVENNTLRVVPVQKDPTEAFRGQGKGGAVKRLLKERAKDRKLE